MKVNKRIASFLLCCVLVVISVFSSAHIVARASVITGVYVNATNVNVRADASTSSASLGHVSNVNASYITQKTGDDGYTWYQVNCQTNEGNNVTGYIRGDFLQLTYSDDISFEDQLAQFPETYHAGLRELHAKYPNWIFYADNVPLTFDEAAQLECEPLRKEVSGSSGNSWRSMGPGAYDWNTNTYITDNGGWVTASREIIRYYMDPRNFLNQTDVYMFMQQSYNPSTQTADGVAKIIQGTFLANGYYDSEDTTYGGSYINVIMEAAKQSNVSPYIIASTIIQEQGTKGTSGLISGTTAYGKYYNFFNVKASGGTEADVLRNGLTYAQNQGWTTRSASIIGGAKIYGEKYISVGQDTYFYKDYNILNPSKIHHQYAQAVHDAYSLGRKAASAYSSDTSSVLTFRIPVYKTIPTVFADCPQNNQWRNNYYLSSISVSGLTPSFSMYNYNYNLYVSGDTTVYVKLVDGARYAGPSALTLNPGMNDIPIYIRAETEYLNSYMISINAEKACTLTISTGDPVTPPPTPTPEPTPDPEPTPEPTPPTVMRGDTNGDNKISLVDLANVQKHLLGIITLTGDRFTGADTNGDNKISLIDLANIQKHLLGVKLLTQ